MQVLEIVRKVFGGLLVSVLIVSQASADSSPKQGEACNPSGVTNSEIIICANLGFSRVDNVLNEQYKLLVGGLSSTQHELLVAGQRAWIKYRDQSCQNVYDSEYPGEEAPIAKLDCLSKLTNTRLGELIYFRTGYVNDGFNKASAILAKAKGETGASVIEKLLAGASDPGRLWADYAQKNCQLSNNLYSEDDANCLGRMRFQSSEY